MKRVLHVIILLCFSVNVLGDNILLTGTYADKQTSDSGCELKVKNLSNQKLQFELNCNRGAPSYNSGLAFGIIELIDRNASYTRKVSGHCVISFKFNEKTVDVLQAGASSECGFGWNVYADGTYLLVNNELPLFKHGNK